MPEEQAFSVLVKIMFDYGLRDLFKQNFEDLHCKFFQLERLMQVCLHSARSFRCFFLCLFFLLSFSKQASSPDSCARCLLTGIHPRSVHSLPQRGSGGAHVRLPVVPHPLHSQVPALHGLPYHWPAAVWGGWRADQTFGNKFGKHR